MTDNLCIGGVRPADTTSSVCIGGVPINRVCVDGTVVYEVGVANPITIAGYLHGFDCAVALSPADAQYSFELRPDGSIWVGTNSVSEYDTGQTWHDGSAAAADYDIMITSLSGPAGNPTTPPAGVWHNLSSAVSIVWDRSLLGEILLNIELNIRETATGTVMGTVTFCQQVGVDVICEAC